MKIINIQIYRILTLILIFFSFKVYSFSASDYLIAGTAISYNDYDTAAEHYYESSVLDSNINFLQKKLVTLINAEKMTEALRVAKKIIKIDNNNEDAWLVILINSLIEKNQKTFDDFDKILTKDNFQIINYIFYTNGMLKNDKYETSITLLNLVKNSNSNDLNQIKDYNYLLFYLNLSLSINKNFSEAFYYKAQFFEQLEKLNKAKENYLKIKKDHFIFLDSQIRISEIEKKLKNYKQGEKILVDLLKRFPNKKNVIISLADYYRSTEQYRKAVLHYTTIRKLDSINRYQLSRVLFMRGICYERLDQWSLAEKDFLKALEINPQDPQILNYLAYGWIERDLNIDKSLEMLKIAYQENPNSHYILDSLAWAHYKKNNLLEAVKLMEKVINLAPGEVVSLDHLGDIYFSMGRKREANYMWKQVIDLAEPDDEILEEIKKKLNEDNAG